MTPRRKFSTRFNKTVVQEAMRGDMTIQEIAAKYQIHPTQVSKWKQMVNDGINSLLDGKHKRVKNNGIDGTTKVAHF